MSKSEPGAEKSARSTPFHSLQETWWKRQSSASGRCNPELIAAERGPRGPLPGSRLAGGTPTDSRLRCLNDPIKQSTIRANLALCDVFVTGPIPLQAVVAGDSSIYHLKRALGKSSARLTVGEWYFKGTDAKSLFFPSTFLP